MSDVVTSTVPELETAPLVAKSEQPLRGFLAEFREHNQLLDAARRAYAAGYRKMDAYSPFPVEELPEALGCRPSLVPLFALLGGMAGGLGGYFMEWYSMSRLYPLNVGGRPLNSWPNFIPVVFELTVLIASLSAFTAMLVLNRLPELHHPVFEVPEFERASIDRFFLFIESEDEQFHQSRTWGFLETLAPLTIKEVRDD